MKDQYLWHLINCHLFNSLGLGLGLGLGLELGLELELGLGHLIYRHFFNSLGLGLGLELELGLWFGPNLYFFVATITFPFIPVTEFFCFDESFQSPRHYYVRVRVRVRVRIRV
jgi:hypothetical protein